MFALSQLRKILHTLAVKEETGLRGFGAFKDLILHKSVRFKKKIVDITVG